MHPVVSVAPSWLISFFYTWLQTETPQVFTTQNKNVFSRQTKGRIVGVSAEEWGVPLGQETGAVTTGSQCENDRGRIPTASPLLSSLHLWFLAAFFLSSGSSSHLPSVFLSAHNHHSVLSAGVWGYLSTATRNMRARLQLHLHKNHVSVLACDVCWGSAHIGQLQHFHLKI